MYMYIQLVQLSKHPTTKVSTKAILDSLQFLQR